MSFNSQKGVVTLATILLGFTIASLLTAGAGVYTHVEERIELSKVVKMIRDNAHTLKKHHADDPRAWAQAEAWERMARSIESHKDIIYSQKMLKEAATLGINLIPGKLPFKKGTKEVIEFVKDIYDTDSALEEAWRDQPQEVSPEMKDFFKALSKGKVDADALEIAMLHTREQALVRKWEEFLAEKKAQEEWQRQQEEQQQEYREMFIQNTLNKLNETGSLPSTYKRLWKQSGLQKELANYPQIADALKKTEVSVTQKEKQEIDDIVHGVVSQNEVLKEALAESLAKKQGDWEKDIAQMVVQMGKIATEGVEIPEEEEKVPPIEEEVIKEEEAVEEEEIKLVGSYTSAIEDKPGFKVVITGGDFELFIPLEEGYVDIKGEVIYDVNLTGHSSGAVNFYLRHQRGDGSWSSWRPYFDEDFSLTGSIGGAYNTRTKEIWFSVTNENYNKIEFTGKFISETEASGKGRGLRRFFDRISWSAKVVE